jgi:hypothetical protein
MILAIYSNLEVKCTNDTQGALLPGYPSFYLQTLDEESKVFYISDLRLDAAFIASPSLVLGFLAFISL